MKNNKSKKATKGGNENELEKMKPKKKLTAAESKVNVKSKKFWEEIYDNEGDDVEKFVR